ncbi:hypothetical protein AB205_0052320 [Aquarana catesbeiana]|uniref:Uncharacterized protein n=1 Tax=Aquarana catesbeiana TaxID=8400 RepID=A0A2G9REE3_AQUCT|nr:hypothetical protein AB205_0052320 [Aquarana catesbeiana]
MWMLWKKNLTSASAHVLIGEIMMCNRDLAPHVSTKLRLHCCRKWPKRKAHWRT